MTCAHAFGYLRMMSSCLSFLGVARSGTGDVALFCLSPHLRIIVRDSGKHNMHTCSVHYMTATSIWHSSVHHLTYQLLLNKC